MDISVKTTENIREQVDLRDNSKVWVNSNSTLKYAADYKEDRQMRLVGDAYFKIEKSDKPFTLKTDDITLILYEGIFQIESFPEKEYTRIVLFDGEAKIITEDLSQAITMNPGTDLTLDKSPEQIEVLKVKEGVKGPEWVTNKYEYMNLNNILYSLSEYYDVSFTNNRPELNNESFTCAFDGNMTLDEVMRILQTISKKISYRIEGKELIIY